MTLTLAAMDEAAKTWKSGGDKQIAKVVREQAGKPRPDGGASLALASVPRRHPERRSAARF
eukprot:5377931-Prymnesium_polylepis.1